MKKWILFILFFLLALFIFTKLGVFTGLSVFLALGDQGGKINYRIEQVDTFVQCFDADPSNQMTIKSACHAQYYEKDSRRLLGMNAIDYCRSSREVIDFYCAQDLSCQEKISSCPESYLCRDGACVKEKKNYFIQLPQFRELKNSFDSLFG